ncbi:DUF962 domain-containing protein [Pedobacter sp. MC2016-14]|uniref:DUF962 domain-containing protein n=1 Tax=Pedobacter sp. MC2016-14 TaxID=2897327 RepID=UPI001E3224C4|nr:DUF962 domain-containing protein [Pedobacter sp. MC2016-14]MCD0489487.1 DUF962 domain-containing protein [Pedobacter sp. MC2016-14]
MQQHTYKSLKEFYPFYLTKHQNTTNRVLHFIGSGLAILCLISAVLFHNLSCLLALPVFAYGFAWIGHFFFEKNRSNSCKHPFFNLASDFLLFGDLMTGRQSFQTNS